MRNKEVLKRTGSRKKLLLNNKKETAETFGIHKERMLAEFAGLLHLSAKELLIPLLEAVYKKSVKKFLSFFF